MSDLTAYEWARRLSEQRKLTEREAHPQDDLDTGLQDGMLAFFNGQTKLTDSYAEMLMSEGGFDFREQIGRPR
jgi:hypothetical protein